MDGYKRMAPFKICFGNLLW